MLLVLRQRVVASLVLVMLMLYVPVSQALESSGFTDLNQRVEQLEKTDAYRLPPDELAAKIAKLRGDLEAFMRKNQDNVDALVLSVRLEYVQEVFINSRKDVKTSAAIGPQEKFLDLHQRLDMAIALHPEYAAAYYWKAALYGMSMTTTDASGDVTQRLIDLPKAIDYARLAVKLDPENQWYRHTLAIYIFTSGDPEAALEVVDSPDMENYPVTQLLKDMQAFPLPKGTIFLQEDTDKYIEVMARQKMIKDFPNLRVRVYFVPMSVEAMTRFYQARWPNFRFFTQERGDLFAQYMLPRGDELRPSAHIGEAKAWASQNMGSIVLSVQEVRNASEEQRRASPAGHRLPVNLWENFSYLFYVNTKAVK